MLPGQNVKIGRDHTIFAIKEGKVKFTRKRKLNFDGKTKYLPVVNVV